MRRCHMLSGALALMLVLPGAAEAARAKADLNVRSGPGTHYRVVGHLARGQNVDVSARKAGWSRIGKTRWVSSAYLSGKAAHRTARHRLSGPDRVALHMNTTATETGITTSDPVWGLTPEDGWEWERMHLLRHAH